MFIKKFRSFLVFEKNNKKVLIPFYSHPTTSHFAIIPKNLLCKKSHSTDPEMFTGVQDKKGYDIYEGDELEQKRVDGKTIRGIVVYNPKTVGFEIQVKNDNNYGFYSCNGTKCVDVEIIGNIHLK